MIHKLRKKLILVLMVILSLMLVAILGSMFFSARMNYERRSLSAFNNPPSAADSFDRSVLMALPVASVTLDKAGCYTVTQNQIHYVNDEELVQIASSIAPTDDTLSGGTISSYNLRYRRHTAPDGTVVFYFSDTFIERDSLHAQVLFSVILGLGALALFFVISLLLSRWMVKPVERSWEKQRQFVADASHELKTPLTVILSNTEMLIDSHAVTDERNRIRLDNIRAESKRMKALIEALLNLARTDSKPTTARENVNLSFILSSAALMFEPAVFDLGRTLESKIEANVTICGNEGKLRQLADILIDNAVQYGADQSPILVRLTKAGKREALLSVVSEGIPLSAEDCNNVFERFYRVDASRGQRKGFGLGLSIARSIAQEHGGKIWAESDGKAKNTFWVRLPVVSTPQKPSASPGSKK